MKLLQADSAARRSSYSVRYTGLDFLKPMKSVAIISKPWKQELAGILPELLRLVSRAQLHHLHG